MGGVKLQVGKAEVVSSILTGSTIFLPEQVYAYSLQVGKAGRPIGFDPLSKPARRG